MRDPGEGRLRGGGTGGLTVWVYTFAWNEEKILPFFLRHYLDWLGAERVTVFDNESTDGTAAVCDADRRVVRSVYHSGDTHSELGHMVRLRNTCWQGARGKADFVIIVDCDELLYHNDMPGFLGAVKASRAAMATATGYEMASRTFPPAGVHLPAHVRTGIFSPTYSKPCLLLPDRVERVAFSAGAHSAHVKADGYTPLQSAALRLLHYPRLGWQFYLDRMKTRQDRMAPKDVEQGLANHYRRPVEAMREEFDHVILNAVDCVT